MSTIAQKLADLAQIKADIRQAIIDKGIDVPSDTPFADYASLIGDISSSGGRDVVTVRSTTTFTITSEEVEE